MLTVRLDSTIQPIGIVGPSFFGISELPANISKEFDVSFSDSFCDRNSRTDKYQPSVQHTWLKSNSTESGAL